jgi:Fe-S cluster assembly scaffold protein SufB
MNNKDLTRLKESEEIEEAVKEAKEEAKEENRSRKKRNQNGKIIEEDIKDFYLSETVETASSKKKKREIRKVFEKAIHPCSFH